MLNISNLIFVKQP